MTLKDRTLICCIDRDTDTVTEFFEESGLENLIILDGYELMMPYKQRPGKKNETCLEKILSDSRIKDGTKVVRYNIHNYDEMMYAVYTAMNNVKRWGSEPYFSIAGGTGEYCAAASMISMMFDRVHLITKDIVDYEVACERQNSEENLDRRKYYITSEGIKDIGKMKIKGPDFPLLKCLWIYCRQFGPKRSSTNMIQVLKEDGIWMEFRKGYDKEVVDPYSLPPEERAKVENQILYKERNFYLRKVVNVWKQYGWIETNERSISGYDISEYG